MLFEDIMLIFGVGVTALFVVIPGYKLIKSLLPQKRNPLKEARERLEIAKQEVEAARLDKERERLYDELYNESLNDSLDDTEHKNHRRN